MIAEELINQMIPALKMHDTAEKAIVWMEELKTDELPVQDDGRFRGLVSEEMILESNNLDLKIGEFKYYAENSYVLYNQHFFDIVRVGQENKASLVAILDDDKSFMGVSSLVDTVKAFGNTTTIQHEGGIIMLSIRVIDYSLSEISRIVEADNVKILGTCISNHPQNDHIYLTIKLDTTDLTRVIATLDRFKYTIVAKFHSTLADEMDMGRIDNLFKYLDL